MTGREAWSADSEDAQPANVCALPVSAAQGVVWVAAAGLVVNRV